MGVRAKRWYALYTKSRAEKKAERELQLKGLEAYLPLEKRLKQWSDRKKWVEFPMFRGYLFLFSRTVYFPKVLEHPAAVHVVRLSGKFAAIPDDQIEFIKKVAENQYLSIKSFGIYKLNLGLIPLQKI